ncbi:MAG TPA: nitroreductase family deazaflavin-dependent oxidoreductase [Candidatus Limnocylindria bacterium]|jgi:deazaflavin-dependent oxidoreductase (nitroreductase family)
MSNIDRAPWHVRFFGRFLKLLLEAGIPLGPNRLVMIRGRRSGSPRVTPLAVIREDGRRWIWAPWGEVQWVRNLRVARRATIRERGRSEEVVAEELDAEERIGFFRDVLAPLAHRIPLGRWFIRAVDGVDVNDPARAASKSRVFELRLR